MFSDQRSLSSLLILLICLLASVNSFRTKLPLVRRTGTTKTNAKIGGQDWGEMGDLECKVLGPVTVLNHLGDYHPYDESSPVNNEYNANVGKALETLRRELPMVFYTASLDFSIFAPQVTVVDNRQNKMTLKKSIYSAAIKSMRMASALSSVYPSMNVKKIEYLEECRTIQCLVDVVLPDSVEIEGRSCWDGIFYFGLDNDGYIETHIFDNKLTNFKPSPKKAASAYPWLDQDVKWSPDLIGGVVKPTPAPVPGYVSAVVVEEEAHI